MGSKSVADRCTLTHLPPELLASVLSFCEPGSLAHLRRVSRFLKQVVDDFVAHLPRSAAEVRARSICSGDGEYQLAVKTERFGLVPLRVYCHDMASESPKEYITLKDEKSNYTTLVTGGTVSGVDVRTTFKKVRLLLPTESKAAMQIVCNDFTFASSKGSVTMRHGNGYSTLFSSAPYGVAINCQGYHSVASKAYIDLRGTGLCIDCSFRAFGYTAKGICSFTKRRQCALVEGGGYTGGCGPKSAVHVHYTTTGNTPDPVVAETVWERLPIVMRVVIAESKTDLDDYRLETHHTSNSWVDRDYPE